jgi:hypothetical protein
VPAHPRHADPLRPCIDLAAFRRRIPKQIRRFPVSQ